MTFNDYFGDYCNWGLLSIFFILKIWIVGSILTFVTCSKQKAIYQTGRSSTVHQTEGVVVANTAPESVPEQEEIQEEEIAKIRYETANDIKNEMSLRHADMEVQNVQSSERMQLQQYEQLRSQAQTKKPNKQSAQNIGKQTMKQAFEKASQLQCQNDREVDENKQSVINAEQIEVQNQQTQDIQQVAVQRLTRSPSAPKQTTRKGSKESCDIKQAGIPEPLRRPSVTKQAVKKVSRETKLGALLEPPLKESVVKKTASKEIKALKNAIQREQQRREFNNRQQIQKENIVINGVDQVDPEPLRQISPTKKILTKNHKYVKRAVQLGAQQKEFQQKMNFVKQDETQGPHRQEMPEKLSLENIEASPQEQQRRISNLNTKLKDGEFVQNHKVTATKAVNLPQRVLRSSVPDPGKAKSPQKVDQPQRVPNMLKQPSVYYDTSAKAKNPAENIKNYKSQLDMKGDWAAIVYLQRLQLFLVFNMNICGPYCISIA